MIQLELGFGCHSEHAASGGERAALAPPIAVVEDADDKSVLDFHGKPGQSKANATAA
jgi:hypothetical protein